MQVLFDAEILQSGSISGKIHRNEVNVPNVGHSGEHMPDQRFGTRGPVVRVSKGVLHQCFPGNDFLNFSTSTQDFVVLG